MNETREKWMEVCALAEKEKDPQQAQGTGSGGHSPIRPAAPHSSVAPMTTTNCWRESYRAAVLETNWRHLRERIRKAQCDMHARLLSLSNQSVDEALQIAQALSSLEGLTNDLMFWLGQSGVGRDDEVLSGWQPVVNKNFVLMMPLN